MRRAARLSLREGLEAVEEMARLAGRLQEMQERRHDAPARVREPGITGASRWPAADPLPPSDTRGE